MHVFFEDDGAFKAGTVLADNDTSLQVETASGKRMKIKAANVLLRFADPSPASLLAEAQALADGIDPAFLWEVSGGGEFTFADLATEYFGHAPRPGEATALAFCLHASPMYFYKKGRGRYKAAPADALKAALAGAERKRREAEEVAALAAELQSGRLPQAIRDSLPMLLFRPDKQAIASRAVTAACEASHTNSLALLAACGAIPSTHDYHFGRFLSEAFPRGTGFPRLRHGAGGPRAAAGPHGQHSRSTMRRLPKSTTPFRYARCPTATSRSAFISLPPRSRFREAPRSTPSRARGCRLSTCRGARSRCCPTR